jgi:hypothetical protein
MQLELREADLAQKMAEIGTRLREIQGLDTSVKALEAIPKKLEERKEAITMSNLNVLTEKYVAQMKELKTRMADTKRKLEIVLAASRLLVEEGLSDEYPPRILPMKREYQKDR